MTYSLSTTGLDFNFAAAQDADDEERASRFWSSPEELAIYDPFNDDDREHDPEASEDFDPDDDFVYETAAALDIFDSNEIDEQLEETFWSSLMLGSDYDWSEELHTEAEIAAWVAERYSDVIGINAAVGFKPINVSIDKPVAEIVLAHNDNQSAEYDLHPLEHTPRPFDSDFRGYNLNRGKEHRLPGGWKRYAGHWYR